MPGRVDPGSGCLLFEEKGKGNGRRGKGGWKGETESRGGRGPAIGI